MSAVFKLGSKVMCAFSMIVSRLIQTNREDASNFRIKLHAYLVSLHKTSIFTYF